MFFLLDIVDVFFAFKLYLLANDSGKYNNYYLWLMISAILFLVLPVGMNVYQLHSEIARWNKDLILRDTALNRWIKNRMKMLYFMSVICGSAFSAIELCNSYLFKLSLFSMGLSQYHKTMFQTKRFFSIVLLEVKFNIYSFDLAFVFLLFLLCFNLFVFLFAACALCCCVLFVNRISDFLKNFPQFVIQLITLSLTIMEGGDAASFLITLLSMIFTIISIMISVLEYSSKSKFINAGCVSVVRFTVESSEIADMKLNEFRKRVVFKRFGILSSFAKSVELQFDEVERLNPLHTKKGAVFTFIMDLQNDDQYENVRIELRNAIRDGTLVRVRYNVVIAVCLFFCVVVVFCCKIFDHRETLAHVLFICCFVFYFCFLTIILMQCIC